MEKVTRVFLAFQKPVVCFGKACNALGTGIITPHSQQAQD
jgi:hypothetical protein